MKTVSQNSKPVDKDFNPSIVHPLYIIRKNVYRGVVRHAGKLKGKMMDFGCGSKPYQSLFTSVDEYIGVDYAGEGHSHENEQIDVFYDGKTIPFPENTFDSVLASEVLEHVFNLEEILKELHRVMKPGGKLLITIPFAWKEHEIPIDFGRYTSFGFRNLLERNGFIVREMDKTTNVVQTLTQLWITYWHSHIFPKMRPFGRVVTPVFSLFSNVFGLTLAKILPKRDDYYLNLIVVAEKK